MVERISEEVRREKRVRPPTHPGRLLELEFLEPMGITPYRLAKSLGVDQMRINRIIRGERAITADTALRLSRYFGMSEEFWLNAQSHYDLEIAKMKSGASIEQEVEPLERAG
ncbi:MAG: HigA family addiction module antidote protein [Rubrobacter sp.]|nr:HigA family addiction module antidote protein [Rubrobacter sp.]